MIPRLYRPLRTRDHQLTLCRHRWNSIQPVKWWHVVSTSSSAAVIDFLDCLCITVANPERLWAHIKVYMTNVKTFINQKKKFSHTWCCCLHGFWLLRASLETKHLYICHYIRIKSVAYCSQGNHAGQLEFCNWLADGSIMRLVLCSIKSNNVDFLNQIHFFSRK